MILYIDGVMVSGTPEEIKRYKDLSKKKPNNKFFNIQDDVPDHVKKYKLGNRSFELKGDSTLRAWY